MNTQRAVLLLSGLLLPLTSHARLGESPARIEARYGIPTTYENGASSRDYRCTYTHDGFTITVQFLDDKSVSEHYHRDAKPFSDEELQRLLDINSRGTKWTKSGKGDSDRKWKLVSGTVANYTAGSENGDFEIVAKWWQDFVAVHPEGSANEACKALKDF